MRPIINIYGDCSTSMTCICVTAPPLSAFMRCAMTRTTLYVFPTRRGRLLSDMSSPHMGAHGSLPMRSSDSLYQPIHGNFCIPDTDFRLARVYSTLDTGSSCHL